MEVDVFISYKRTDENDAPTEDYRIAKVLVKELRTFGLRVFFSAETIQQLGESRYKNAIDQALDKAKVMVVVLTSVENAESKWVQYEWDTYYNDFLSGRRKKANLFSLVKNIHNGDLPRTLRNVQSYHVDDMGGLVHTILVALNKIPQVNNDLLSEPQLLQDTFDDASVDMASNGNDEETGSSFAFAPVLCRLLNLRNNKKQKNQNDERSILSPKRKSKNSFSGRFALRLIAFLIIFVASWIAVQYWNAQGNYPIVEVSQIDSPVMIGSDIEFDVFIEDDKNISDFSLSANDIILDSGLFAEVYVMGIGSNRSVILKDVYGTEGSHSVTIRSGVAKNIYGKENPAVCSNLWMLVDEIPADATIPTVNLSKPTIGTNAIEFTIFFDDETNIDSISLTANDITTYGFAANIEILGEGLTKLIRLTDVRCDQNATGDCMIVIAGGVAKDASGNESKTIQSCVFQIGDLHK